MMLGSHLDAHIMSKFIETIIVSLPINLMRLIFRWIRVFDAELLVLSFPFSRGGNLNQ